MKQIPLSDLPARRRHRRPIGNGRKAPNPQVLDTPGQGAIMANNVSLTYVSRHISTTANARTPMTFACGNANFTIHTQPRPDEACLHLLCHAFVSRFHTVPGRFARIAPAHLQREVMLLARAA